MAIPTPTRVQINIETTSMNWSSRAAGAGATQTLEVVSMGQPSMGQLSLLSTKERSRAESDRGHWP